MALPTNEYNYSIPIPSKKRGFLFRLWHPCSGKRTWQPTKERRGESFSGLFRLRRKSPESNELQRRFSASDAEIFRQGTTGQTGWAAAGVYENGAGHGPRVQTRQMIERGSSGQLIMRPISHGAPQQQRAPILMKVDSFYQPNSARSDVGSSVRTLCDGDEDINKHYYKAELCLQQRKYMLAADGYERCIQLMGVFPVEHFLLDRAHCLRRLARVYESVHDTATAEEYLTCALRVLARVDDEHGAELEKAGCYSQLGVVKKMAYEYTAAAKNFKLAQEVYEDRVPDDDPRLLFVLNGRAESLGRIGALKPALEIATRVVGIARSARSAHMPRFERNLQLIQGMHRTYGDYVDALGPMESLRSSMESEKGGGSERGLSSNRSSLELSMESGLAGKGMLAHAGGKGVLTHTGSQRFRPPVEAIQEAKTPTGMSPRDKG